MAIRRILIVGAGYSGTVVANKVARECRKQIAKEELEILILDRNEISINQGGFTFLPFGLYDPEDIIKPRKKLLSPRVKTVFGEDGNVSKVDLNARKVISSSGRDYGYDYLVIATGCIPDIDSIPGLKDELNTFYTSIEDANKVGELISSIDKGNITISAARMPIPCPGAIVKFTFMLDSYLKHVRKIRDQINITLLWPMEPIGPPAFNKLVTEKLEEAGVKVIKNFVLAEVDGKTKEVVSKTGAREKYDILITVPPYKSIKALIDSGITNETGWISSDTTTLQYRGPAGNHDEVFVLGDTGPADMLKTGIGAHYQSLVVSHNLINIIHGREVHPLYLGETGCPLITTMVTPSTQGEAYIASWGYEKPLKEFKPTKMGWYLYRMYYYIHWDASLKGVI